MTDPARASQEALPAPLQHALRELGQLVLGVVAELDPPAVLLTRKPPPPALLSLAGKLGCTVDDLYAGRVLSICILQKSGAVRTMARAPEQVRDRCVLAVAIRHVDAQRNRLQEQMAAAR